MTEAEQQVLLAVGRYRSRYTLMMYKPIDKAPTWDDLEAFGATWFHKLKGNWAPALENLKSQGLVTEEDSRWQLTDSGTQELLELELHRPLWLYEYENYYSIAPESKAHQHFCKEVYGKDLCQHGLVDQPQLQLLLDQLELKPTDNVVDLGCGNGFITAWLAKETQASVIGIDLSGSAIQQAHPLAAGLDTRLKFVVDNLNDLSLPKGMFDVAISFDTMYYLKDTATTLRSVRELLRPGGRMALFFTQWVMDESESERLQANKTDLAVELNAQSFSYDAFDLSEEGRQHWQRKLKVLNELEDEFKAEGQEWLHGFRHREAYRYASWDQSLTSRYLYIVRV